MPRRVLPVPSTGRFCLLVIPLVSIQLTFVGKLIWRPGRARKPPPSSRRFSITAASSGTAGLAPWRIWAWRERMHCRRKLHRGRMAPPASERSQPTKISSHSGKTPTATFPSISQPGPSTRVCGKRLDAAVVHLRLSGPLLRFPPNLLRIAIPTSLNVVARVVASSASPRPPLPCPDRAVLGLVRKVRAPFLHLRLALPFLIRHSLLALPTQPRQSLAV